MALSNSALSTLMQAKLTAAFGSPPDADTLKEACDAIAEAVVEHITTAAVVTGTCPGGSGGPLTLGKVT